MKFTKEALAAVNDTMGDDDRIEVIAFDAVAARAVPMQWGSEHEGIAAGIAALSRVGAPTRPQRCDSRPTIPSPRRANGSMRSW